MTNPGQWCKVMLQHIAAESKRRGSKFQEWAAGASAGDWQRLGRAYIAQSQETTSHRLLDATGFSTALVGAVAEMLPGARFVAIRSNPLDACWSCFKSDYPSGHGYSYDFAELAACWHDHQRLLQRWNERYAERIHVVVAADVQADPKAAIARLLAHIGLEPADDMSRSIDEIQTHDRVAGSVYGDLLKPLAQMIAARDDAT